MNTYLKTDTNQFRDVLANVRKDQLLNTSSIIASQERIASQIDNTLSSINTTLNDIGSMTSWQLSNIVWILEKQTIFLHQILVTLQTPLDTAAKELRRRAEEAFKNGWYEEALEDFVKSEKANPYDFSVYQSIGLIYFNEKKYDISLDYFLKAAKYAKPKSPQHSSYSLLFVSKIYRINKDYEASLKTTQEAVSLAPSLAEAYYQHAINLSYVSNYEEAINSLRHSIKLDKYYVLKPRTDPDCERLIPYLKNLENELYSDSKIQATKAIENAKKVNLLIQESNETQVAFKEAEVFFNRDSYLDYLDSLLFSTKSIEKASSFASSKITMGNSEVLILEEKIKKAWNGSIIWTIIVLLGSSIIGLFQLGGFFLIYLIPCAIWIGSYYLKQNSAISFKEKWESILKEINSLK